VNALAEVLVCEDTAKVRGALLKPGKNTQKLKRIIYPLREIEAQGKASKDYEHKALQLAHKLKRDYQRIVKDIQKQAEDVLFSPVDPPSEHERRLNNMQKKLENVVLFVVSA
jgi:hypothetical protein